MYARLLTGMLLAATTQAVVVDRIAIVVGDRVVKTSDIDREVRVTELLNGDTLDLSADARKKAAERLIDQALIRREIETGGYATATEEDANAMIAQISKERFGSTSAFHAALQQYGVTEEQLRRHVRWQLSVLRFIETRFRPGVLVTDQDIERYYAENYANGKATPAPIASVRSKIEDQITGERINKAFYAWLEEVRKQANPEYHDGAFE